MKMKIPTMTSNLWKKRRNDNIENNNKTALQTEQKSQMNTYWNGKTEPIVTSKT